MKTIFIIHGTKGSPEGNWFQWVGEKCMERGYSVIIPRFGTPENQNLQSWKEVLYRYKKYISSDTVFIGHSLGSVFILSILEEMDVVVEKCILVSGFLGKLGILEYDTLNDSFVDKVFNWDRVKSHCKKFHILFGENDPYVPRKNAEELGKNLGVSLEIISGGKHLNSEAGYTQFPRILEII